jgi:nitrous oxide reductase
MANESSNAPLTRMNRRQMLGTTTAVLGGVVAGVAGDAFAQEKPTAPAAAKMSPAVATGPYLNPPVIEINGG